MQNWIQEELSSIKLCDKRLNKRLGKLLDNLSEKPNSSIPQACGSIGATKAAYRFFDSERVSVRNIHEGFFATTCDRIAKEKMVLAIQDTTGLDYSSHNATQGLGYLETQWTRGIKVHSTLAISEEGVPLGLVEQQQWVRDAEGYGKKHQRKKKPLEEKESRFWVESLKSVQRRISPSTRVLMIADRESDIYDVFAEPRREGFDLLIRIAHNRRVVGSSKYLFDKVLASPVLGNGKISINRARNRKARQATVEIRSCSVELLPPRHRTAEHLPTVKLQVIYVQEVDVPDGITPVRWMLFTTLAVDTFEDAMRCVHYYTLRWLIERYHYVLKSGCQVEELQLENVKRLQRAIAVYCIIAWRLLYLTYLGRTEPTRSCEDILNRDECEALHCFVNETSSPPQNIPSVGEVIRMIGKLGGFLGRRGDGQPGVKVLWRGWSRLNDITRAYLLFKNVGNE